MSSSFSKPLPDDPLITVIIPTYNRCLHLESAVKTILKQTYARLELLVINNNCTDGTGEMLERLAATDDRLRQVHEPLQGLNPARNRGLTEARGEVVAYFDDDELAPTGWLRQHLECYRATGAEGVGGAYRSLWEGIPPRWLQNSECFKEALGVCTWSRERSEAAWLVGGNCSYRREALEAVGGFGDYAGYTCGTSAADGADVKLGDRLNEAGYKLWFEPAAYVFHKILRSRQNLRTVMRRAFWTGYASAIHEQGYDLKEKATLARKRGRDAYFLGACLVPGYVYGKFAARLWARQSPQDADAGGGDPQEAFSSVAVNHAPRQHHIAALPHQV